MMIDPALTPNMIEALVYGNGRWSAEFRTRVSARKSCTAEEFAQNPLQSDEAQRDFALWMAVRNEIEMWPNGKVYWAGVHSFNGDGKALVCWPWDLTKAAIFSVEQWSRRSEASYRAVAWLWGSVAPDVPRHRAGLNYRIVRDGTSGEIDHSEDYAMLMVYCGEGPRGHLWTPLARVWRYGEDHLVLPIPLPKMLGVASDGQIEWVGRIEAKLRTWQKVAEFQRQPILNRAVRASDVLLAGPARQGV